MTIAETQRTADLVLRISRERGKTILVIEHDMHFVRRLACRVVVICAAECFATAPMNRRRPILR